MSKATEMPDSAAFTKIYFDNFKPSTEILKVVEEACPSSMHDYYFNKGWEEKGKKHYPESLVLFEKAAALDISSAETWHNVGAIYLLLKENKKGQDALLKALDLYAQRIRKNSRSAWDWFWKSCVNALLRDKKKAFADLKRAILIDPSYRLKARTEEDYQFYFNDEEFKKIVKS